MCACGGNSPPLDYLRSSYSLLEQIINSTLRLFQFLFLLQNIPTRGVATVHKYGIEFSILRVAKE